jgi:hypothetical protein
VLDDIPACLIARFLHFCYDPHTYPDTISSPSSYERESSWQSTWDDDYLDADRNNLTAAGLAIKLYELGDRFDAQGLKSVSRNAFLRAWTNIDNQEHTGLTPGESSFYADISSIKSPDAFSDLVKQVYSTTHCDDRGLRDIVFRTMKWHLINFHHYLPGFECLQHIVKDNPDLAMDLALYTVSEADQLCENCQNYQRFVEYPCSCEFRSVDCREPTCVDARRDRVFCFSCCKFGTLSPDSSSTWRTSRHI